MVAREKRCWRLGEKGEGIELQNSYGDVKYSTGNRANNVIIIVYGARWVPDILGEPLCKVYGCLTSMLYICYKIILYTNYN